MNLRSEKAAILSYFAIYYQQNLQVVRSGAERVYLSGVNWATEGAFRCEVTADDFETVADSRQSNVVGEADSTNFDGNLQ